MAAGKLDLDVEQRATYRKRLIWQQPGGQPKDLTDCTARLQIRPNAAADPVISLTETDGITLGTTDGSISLLITADRTTLLTGRRYKYDLLIEFPGGDVVRVVEGTISVDPGITTP